MSEAETKMLMGVAEGLRRIADALEGRVQNEQDCVALVHALTRPAYPALKVFDFSVRLLNCLERAGIETTEQLLSHSGRWYLTLPHLGRTSLKEMETKLSEYGLSLPAVGVGELSYQEMTDE
jgi:DNA-directed RNA polymerase alpha subunit